MEGKQNREEERRREKRQSLAELKQSMVEGRSFGCHVCFEYAVVYVTPFSLFLSSLFFSLLSSFFFSLLLTLTFSPIPLDGGIILVVMVTAGTHFFTSDTFQRSGRVLLTFRTVLPFYGKRERED